MIRDGDGKAEYNSLFDRERALNREKHKIRKVSERLVGFLESVETVRTRIESFSSRKAAALSAKSSDVDVAAVMRDLEYTVRKESKYVGILKIKIDKYLLEDEEEFLLFKAVAETSRHDDRSLKYVRELAPICEGIFQLVKRVSGLLEELKEKAEKERRVIRENRGVLGFETCQTAIAKLEEDYALKIEYEDIISELRGYYLQADRMKRIILQDRAYWVLEEGQHDGQCLLAIFGTLAGTIILAKALMAAPLLGFSTKKIARPVKDLLAKHGFTEAWFESATEDLKTRVFSLKKDPSLLRG